jgi:hypothetical protein
MKSVLSERIVWIAIQPALSRLGGRNDGMLSRPHMLGGVAIGRRIAAQCDTARLARSKVNPTGADFHALLAFVPRGMADGVD